MSPGLAIPPALVTALVSLYHRLHTIGVELVVRSERHGTSHLPAVVDPLKDDLAELAPAVLHALEQINPDDVADMLITEVTESHRLLGHWLRDHGIDPGQPPHPVEGILSAALEQNSPPQLELNP